MPSPIGAVRLAYMRESRANRNLFMIDLLLVVFLTRSVRNGFSVLGVVGGFWLVYLIGS